MADETEKTRALNDERPINTHLSDFAAGSNSSNGDVTTHYEYDATILNSGRARARQRWVTVELIVLLIAASYGGMTTLKGEYIHMRITDEVSNGTHINSSISVCELGNASVALQDEIQKETAQWSLYLGIASTFPCIFTTLLIGTLSERYGRRLAIVLPCIGFLVQIVVSLCVVYLTLPLNVFYVGEFTSGLTGGLSLFMAGCFSYITDITEERQRMVRIVICELLVFIGIGGIQIGLGYMIGLFGFALSLWVPFAATLVGILNAASPCLLIETVDQAKAAMEQRTVKSLLGDILRLFQVKTDNRRWILLTCVVIVLLSAVVIQGSIALTVLYGQGQPYCWESSTIGFFVMISLLVPGIGCIVGVGVFSCFKLKYLWVVDIAFWSYLASTLTIAMTFTVQSTKLLFASAFIGIFKHLGVPVIRTFMSTIVHREEHGALFASLGVLDSISLFVAPILLNGIYAATVKELPTAVFFVMSAMLLVPIILTGIMQCTGVEKKKLVDRPLLVNYGEDDERHALLTD